MGRFAAVLALLAFVPCLHGQDSKNAVVLGTLKSEAPAAWKPKESTFKTRLATFVVPRAKGDERDAEVQVIFFGEGGGGGLPENIKRWKGMFQIPEGKTIADIGKEEKFKVGKASVTTLDIEGTYLDKFPPFDPKAKTTPRPDYRRVNVYFEADSGVYFIVFVGPTKSVSEQKKAFDDWIKAFK